MCHFEPKCETCLQHINHKEFVGCNWAVYKIQPLSDSCILWGFQAGATLCNNICTVLATVQMLQHVTDDMPGYMWVNTEKACIFKQCPLQCSFRAKIIKNWTWSDIAPSSVAMSSGMMLVGLVIAQWVVGCSLDRLWQHNLSVMVLSFLFVFSCVMVLGFKFVISYFIV